MPKQEKRQEKKKEAKGSKKIVVFAAAAIVLIILAFTFGMVFSGKKEVKEKETNICTPDWQCSEWGKCTDELQARACSDANNCPDALRPAESQSCQFPSNTVSVGKSIVSYQITYNVDKVTTAGKVGSKNANGIYYIVEMTLTNKREQSLTLNSLPFELVDSRGNRYSYDAEAEGYYDIDGIKALTIDQKFMPNTPVTGVKIFDVAEGATGLKLKIGCCDLVSKDEFIEFGI